jgi:hypothetical protein
MTVNVMLTRPCSPPSAARKAGWHAAESPEAVVHDAYTVGAVRSRYGLQTVCEGGGQPNATIIERLA